MSPIFKEELEKIEIKTEKPEDIMEKVISESLDGERVFLSVNYRIFKGYKMDSKGKFIMSTEFGKEDQKIPDYKIYSLDRVFSNNLSGKSQLEELSSQFKEEADIKNYFKL